jgi:hypothetical protein
MHVFLLTAPPLRCPDCRRAWAAAQGALSVPTWDDDERSVADLV